VDVNQTLEIELEVPLRWDAVDAFPEAGQIDNQSVLMLIESLADRPTRTTEEEGEGSERQRLENKIDLVLQLLVQLLRNNNPLPPNQALRLSATHLSWQPQTHLAEGQGIVFQLYPEPRLPYPLQLNARVEAQNGQQVRARFVGLGEEASDALQRWIFRRHRRQVAESRQRQR
jgi:hypothetical protein